MQFIHQIRFRNLLFAGIALSLSYNLLFIGLYYLMLEYTQIHIFVLSLFFLVGYIFLAMPLKDMIYSSLLSRYIYAGRYQPARLERRIHALNSLKEVDQFLSELVKLWGLPKLRYVLYQPKPKMQFITASGKRKWVNFRKPEDPDFLQFLKDNPYPRNTHDFPGSLKQYLYNREVRSVVPILYRETIVGFLGFPISLNHIYQKTAEHLTRKIALITENENLRDLLPRHRVLTHEFNVADRIESFLERDEEIEAQSYILYKLNRNWQRKNFPALFEVNLDQFPDGFWQGSVISDHNKNLYAILCRLSLDSSKARSLQLFVIQGYFLALSRISNSLEDLATRLQYTLETHENYKIKLDGFLASVTPTGQWQLMTFGAGLSYQLNAQMHTVEETTPLGSRDYKNSKLIDIGAPGSLVLRIKNISLLWIGKKI